MKILRDTYYSPLMTNLIIRIPCRRGRGREGVILRRRGRDRRPRRRDVDGRLELLAVLLLLLLLRLLVIGTSAVPATSAPVEHSLPPRATTAASAKHGKYSRLMKLP